MSALTNRIIILDDVELNNALMAEAVRAIPQCVSYTFTKPAEALSFVRDNGDDLGVVITDYDMPGTTGIEFIRGVRAIHAARHVPMVMVTSHDQRALRREALEAGATDFLAKPFDPVEVKARVTNLLVLHRALRFEQDRSAWLAREIAAATATIEAREREIVTRLAIAAEYRDTDTGGHVSRVASYAGGIAAVLGCDPTWCRKIELASTMHDIGKIAVPDAVLLKPGSLTPAERKTICRHAEAGYRILEGSSSDVVQLAAEIAISHHERWDGQGYPRGLRGEAIPLSGRIVAVADVYDALCSARPYKPAWHDGDALTYIEEYAGTQFDPSCVAAFMSLPHRLKAA